MEEEKEVQVEAPAEETQEVQAEVPAETKTDETAEVVEQPPAKKKETMQEAFNKAYRKQKEAERKAEYLERLLLEKEQAPKVIEPQVPVLSGRPTLDQFETTQEYEDKLFEWYEQNKTAKSAAQKREQELTNAYRTYEERADKARAELEDFDDVIKHTPYTETMKVALWKNENGPDLAYYIATHPKDGDRIRALEPDEQLVELGRLETKLLIAKSTKKATSAPPPITPVGMGGGGKDKDPSEMTIEEWMIWDKQKTMEKLKKKYG
jgi:hypothetical protein